MSFWSPNTKPDVHQRFTNDRAALLAAVQKEGWTLRYGILELRNDKELVLTAVQQDGTALEYASEALKNDKDIVRVAVNQSGKALQRASENLRNDKEIVLKAVAQDGYALEYASLRLQNDKEIVLKAVAQDGHALQYASLRLQNDKEIVLKAVQESGNALEYASLRLQNDKAIVLAAIQKDDYALKYASDALKNDEDVVLAATRDRRSELLYSGKPPDKEEYIAEEYIATVSSRSQATTLMETQEGSVPSSSNDDLISRQISSLPAKPRDVYFDRPHELIKFGEIGGPNHINDTDRSMESLYVELHNFSANIMDRLKDLEHQVRTINTKLEKDRYMTSQLSQTQSTTPPTTQTSSGLRDDSLSSPPPKDQLSIVKSESQADPAVLRKQQRFNTYIHENAETLRPGQWLSFTDDSPNPKKYKTYQEASKSDRHRPGWFCDQFRGLNPEPYEIDAAEGRFYRLSRLISTEAAYVDVIISNPQTRASLQRRIKIDPGADMTYADRRDIKSLLAPVHSYNQASIGIGGRVETNKHEIEIQVGQLPPMTILISCPTEEEKTDGKWLLGQNYLEFCKHTWTNKTKVEIQALETFIPSPDPGDLGPSATSVYMNQAQASDRCQIT